MHLPNLVNSYNNFNKIIILYLECSLVNSGITLDSYILSNI